MFENVFGHGSAVSFLKTAIENNSLPRVILLHGPKGIGKNLISLEICKYVFCVNRSSGCSCDICKKVTIDCHEFIFSYSVQEGSRSFLVKQSKDIVKKIKSFQNNMKIFIIKEAERMTGPAANALLKTLEEVDENSLFILQTTDLDSVLYTVSSRAIKIPLYHITNNDILNYLSNNSIDQKYLVNLSGGNLGNIKKIVDGDFVYNRDKIYSFISNIKNFSELDLFEYRDLFIGSTVNVSNNLDILLSIIRDSICILRGGSLDLIRNFDILDSITAITLTFSEDLLFYFLLTIRDFYRRLEYNINQRLQTTSFLLRMKMGSVVL